MPRSDFTSAPPPTQSAVRCLNLQFPVSASPFVVHSRNSEAISRLHKGLQQLKTPRLIPGQQSSRTYVILFAIYATLAVCTCALPAESADLLFGRRPGGHPEAVCTLMQLLTGSFASASFISLTLQRALEDQPISQQKFERLNLGLSAFATLNILLLATSLVSPEGSIHFPLRPGFWASALVYFLTVSAGWGRYARKGGFGQTVRDTIPGLPAIKRDVQNAMADSGDYFPDSYTIITLSLMAWGLAQFFVPWEMLNLLIRNDGGAETELMGRLLSCGMITMLPALSYSLKEVSREEATKSLPSKTLHAGLAASALVNVAVLLPYIPQGRGGALLVAYLALWSATLVTSGRNAVFPSKQTRTPKA